MCLGHKVAETRIVSNEEFAARQLALRHLTSTAAGSAVATPNGFFAIAAHKPMSKKAVRDAALKGTHLMREVEAVARSVNLFKYGLDGTLQFPGVHFDDGMTDAEKLDRLLERLDLMAEMNVRDGFLGRLEDAARKDLRKASKRG